MEEYVFFLEREVEKALCLSRQISQSDCEISSNCGKNMYMLRMSNKSNSFESDLLYFQKGPVPYKADYI